MPHLEFGWKTGDGLELFARDWRPLAEPRAVICLVHGLGEHSGRYSRVAGFLNGTGCALLALDLRGHGRSEGKRGHTPDVEALMDDISNLLMEAEKRYPGSPRFLYGHSMGGNLVINFALRRNSRLRGVIASAPLLRTAFDPPRWKLIIVKIMRSLWPSFSTSNELEVNWLSRDQAVVQAYRDDPLVHDRVTATFLDIREAGVWAVEHAGELSLPLLLMHGDADRITSLRASREFAAGAGDGCTLKIWNGLYHEIHSEPEREDVLSCLARWLNSKL